MPGIVTFVFDDASTSVKDIAQSIMAAQGFVGSIPVVTGALSGKYLDEYKTLEPKELLEMQTAGWEIISHSHYHELPISSYVDLARIEYDLSESKRILDCLGFTPYGGAWPGGGYNQTTIDKAKLYYSFFRSSDLGLNELSLAGDDLYRLKAVFPNTLSDCQNYIDQAANQNKWLCLSFHGFHASQSSGVLMLTSHFQDIVNYVKTKVDAGTIQVKTFGQHLGLTYNQQSNVYAVGESGLEEWYYRDDTNPVRHWPTGWGRIYAGGTYTATDRESNIKNAGSYSCKVTSSSTGMGIERGLFVPLVNKKADIKLYVTQGRFKITLVDQARNTISHSHEDDMLETSAGDLNTWKTLTKVLPDRNPLDTYLHVTALDENSICYVDDLLVVDHIESPTFANVDILKLGATIVATCGITNRQEGDTVAFFYRDANASEPIPQPHEAGQTTWFPIDDSLVQEVDTFTATEAIIDELPDSVMVIVGVLRDGTWYYSEESSSLTIRHTIDFPVATIYTPPAGIYITNIVSFPPATVYVKPVAMRVSEGYLLVSAMVLNASCSSRVIVRGNANNAMLLLVQALAKVIVRSSASSALILDAYIKILLIASKIFVLPEENAFALEEERDIVLPEEKDIYL